MKFIIALALGLGFIGSAVAKDHHVSYLQLGCPTCEAPKLRSRPRLEPPPVRPVANPPRAHR